MLFVRFGDFKINKPQRNLKAPEKRGTWVFFPEAVDRFYLTRTKWQKMPYIRKVSKGRRIRLKGTSIICYVPKKDLVGAVDPRLYKILAKEGHIVRRKQGRLRNGERIEWVGLDYIGYMKVRKYLSTFHLKTWNEILALGGKTKRDISKMSSWEKNIPVNCFIEAFICLR